MDFIRSLEAYRDRAAAASSGHQDQVAEADRCLAFLASEPDCFERSNGRGHFTGSSLVVDPVRREVLLVHHRKYGKWVQPGGHCDGIRDPFFTAWQETYQETGLKDVVPVNPWRILDIDIQPVPEYGGVSVHLHYDIRYLFAASANESPVVSAESNDVSWVRIDRVSEYSREEPLLRLVEAYFGPGSTRSRP